MHGDDDARKNEVSFDLRLLSVSFLCVLDMLLMINYGPPRRGGLTFYVPKVRVVAIKTTLYFM